LQVTPIRIGTRGSPLALAQAHEVAARLAAAHVVEKSSIEIRVIKTTGDIILDRPLAEAGGKGLFTKEIEEALISGDIDLAVHSMKDMQTALPQGLAIGAVLPREDVRDAFISLKHETLADMPTGAVVGTSSLRRQAQVKRLRPDLKVTGLRGNVQTRLRKLSEGEADATFLACAGLNRLGMADRITAAVPVADMIPAVAQGAIAIEIKSDDPHAAKLCTALNDEQTAICVTTERAFLARLEGSCRTPIAGHAVLASGTVMFRGVVFSLDGAQSIEVSMNGPVDGAHDLGTRAANDLLKRGAGEVLQRIG
jgi:hydroxymethylbilane synthase